MLKFTPSSERRTFGAHFCKIGRLHQSNYQRKVRGISSDIDNSYLRCFSLCCSFCRKRVKVPSVRFWGQSCYALYFVVLFFYFLYKNITEIPEFFCKFNLSAKTIIRWRNKWNEFSLSSFWKYHQGSFNGQLKIFPIDLLDYYIFNHQSEKNSEKKDPLMSLLIFLSKLRGYDNSS